jgi:hypothetical protein
VEHFIEGNNRFGKGCLLVMLAMFLCVGGTVFGLDRYCATALGWRVPQHPEAKLLRQTYNFINPNGIGNTVSVYFVPGGEDEIRSWYNRQVGLKAVEATRDQALARYYGITGVILDVTTAAEGNGSQVIVIARCISGNVN